MVPREIVHIQWWQLRMRVKILGNHGLGRVVPDIGV